MTTYKKDEQKKGETMKKIAYTLNGRSLKQVALDSRSDRLLKGGRGTL